MQIKSDWFKKDPWQDGWKSKILPTLYLWAPAQSNMWTTPKDIIASILTIIVPVIFPDLNTFACGLMPIHKCVEATWCGLSSTHTVYELFHGHLQNAIINKVTELLKNNSFHYEDLNTGEPKKAFHSDFIVHLFTTTYIPSIKGHAHVDGIKTIKLASSGIKGILGLCSAAIKRGLQLSSIVGLEALMKGKTMLHTPATFNKQAGRATDKISLTPDGILIT
ncbi:hypothetical protein J3R82DRAFT_2313 [Butyriboletus roseoflavus]|nr:hypothetical protein J3R82DRAFT_2313 [Butyriboletus roseoflavus]